jgi:hypothetical protein
MATRPTKNPRVAFVPSDAVHALLIKVSELSGQSKASVVSELMDEVAPVVQGQIDALLALKATPERAKQFVQDYAMRAMSEIAQTSIDFAASEDARTVEAQKSRRRSARAATKP